MFGTIRTISARKEEEKNVIIVAHLKFLCSVLCSLSNSGGVSNNLTVL